MDLTIKKIERFWVEMPFREIPAQHMARQLPHWNLFEICRVRLSCGIAGIGETMCYYTWKEVTDESVQGVLGRNAADYMWDDSLGAGLQMALFDAVGRALEVPVHRLLGTRCRDRASLSWWVIDMPADDWLAEGQEAVKQGYTNLKTKTRPWFDIEQQCDLLARELPPWFDIDLDFNESLLDTAHAPSILKRIEGYRGVAIYESPILQADVEGNRYLKRIASTPIAMHCGNPPIMTALHRDICDGFVVKGGASQVLEEAHIIAAANKVFWLQLVGTSIAATWGLHLAAVASHARWPAVNCHQLFSRQIAKPGIEVSRGSATVPEAPGLGIELDEEAVEAFRIDPKAKPYPTEGLLIAIRWPSESTSYYAHALQYWDDFMAGRLPIYPPGVYLEQIPDDGSREWKELQARARKGGVHTAESAL